MAKSSKKSTSKNHKAITKGKGKAMFVRTNKGIYPMSALDGFAITKTEYVSGDSKQLKQLNDFISQNGLIDPIYSGSAFLSLYESTPVFYACVQQIAKDVAGLGWTLNLEEGENKDDNQVKAAKDFLKNINPEMPLRMLFKELLIDWGTIGYFGIEIVRDKTDKISKAYRLPAHTLWMHESKKKFCQIRDEKKRWFRAFNAPKIRAEDGKEDTNGDATEVIYYKNPYPKSDYYGVPNIISAVGDVIGLISARDYNINFFSNYGIPTAIITLTGEWEEDAEEKIKKFLSSEVKGLENAHRSLVLSQTEECKVEVTPIDTNVKEGSFNIYERTRKENILISYSMPPERIGVRVTGELGGNVAQEATKVYVSGVVDPLQQDMEDIINLLLDSLEVNSYTFKFNDIDIRDTKVLTELLCKQVEHGIKSPNQARRILGDQPYEGGDRYYILSNLLPIDSVPLPGDDELLEEDDED